jgi:hypothetical protein
VDSPDFGSLPRLTIDLQAADTPDRYCVEYVDWLYPRYTAYVGNQFPGYSRLGTGTSVAVLPPTYAEWFEQVGYYTRRKVRRAEKRGYTFAPIDRDRYLADIHEINTSLEERQGRPMDEKYQREVKPFGPLPQQPCPRHRLCTYGVLLDGKLVAYTWVYQTGEMFLLSTILGHGDHLSNGTMYLLIAGVIKDLLETADAKYAVYERHWSGTEGLRFFKEQMGFRPYLVGWLRGDELPPTRREQIASILTAGRKRTKVAMSQQSQSLRARLTATKTKVRRLLGRVKRKVLAGLGAGGGGTR